MIEQIQSSLKFNSLKYRDYNLSFGYGYNWVFAKELSAQRFANASYRL